MVVHNASSLSSPIARPATSTAVAAVEPTKLSSGSPSNPPLTLRHRPPVTTKTRLEIQTYNSGCRSSVFRHEEVFSRSDEETRRESVSSRGSWIRKLSSLPNSHNNSPRSSVGPDSPSFPAWHSFTGPILSSPTDSSAQLHANKLVKRNAPGRATSGPVSRRRTHSQVPTLRRPATSHQRSVTLQQQFKDDSSNTQEPRQLSPSDQKRVTPSSRNGTAESRRTWRLYFDSQPIKISKERASGRLSDGSLTIPSSTSRRIIYHDSAKPILVKPGNVVRGRNNSTVYCDDSFELEDDGVDAAEDTPLPSVEVAAESRTRPRRSLSMHFSSPSSWVSRSVSLRGSKRGARNEGGGRRYSSAPSPDRKTPIAHGTAASKFPPTNDPGVSQNQSLPPPQDPSSNDPFANHLPRRSRNSSSPLPPLSRLSSFNVDLARLRLVSSPSSGPHGSRSTIIHNNTTTTSVSSMSHASPASLPSVGTASSKPLRLSELTDRSSTLVGSDNDMKGLNCGEDDDMDFQSETVYDSLRSGATGSVRSHNAALDSMFDESPPSVSGISKSKRLSIHEMLANGGFQEGNNRILEDDEGMSTPVKGGGRSSQEDGHETPVRKHTRPVVEESIPSSPPSFCLATKDFNNLSLDEEDEDEDWTRDDENLEVGSQLSPPSSSMNSRKVSHGFRAALADMTHSGPMNSINGLSTERSRSTIFDWSEPMSAEKAGTMGKSLRPKTAHISQMADGRGGRAVGRRGPSVLHIRSQSVPVVPDVAGQRERTTLIPKFGTWGLGGKGVSEDWDGDFEFDETNEMDDTEDGDFKMENSGMLVPPAIQASQANVVGHVGQIREVCLLVEDLKRLRLLAKEKDLLNGPSATLWQEAEGIIALAVPDEEVLDQSTPDSPSSDVFDRDVSDDDDYHQSGPDAEDLSISHPAFDVLNRHGQPTGLTYDGNAVRRRSVFSPDDDIFGPGMLNTPPIKDHLRPPSTSPRHSSMKSSSDVARSVMETMHQHRSTSDPLIQAFASQSSPNKMPFDTTSLRDLVHRASMLNRTLADLIRKADGNPHSPDITPHRESSPAFTRVFTDPSASPPKHLLRSQSNNSMLAGGSLDGSPTRSLGNRMHLMTVV